MKQLPIDVSVFATMIKKNYLYVDKSKHIYQLLATGTRYFFLSRPRRFGKSLLISTLKSFFQGERELFKGLWIGEQADIIWKKYPVIHLDFSQVDYETPAELKKSIMYRLDKIARNHGIDISLAFTPKTKLELLVEKLAEQEEVVILVDEYDKPIIDYITEPEKADANRQVLKSFYDGFKGLDEHLRGIFITGVSRFSKTSIFSGLNNLNDITLDPVANALVGYTEEELTTNFAEYIAALAKEEHIPIKATLNKIKAWYNGYQFSSKDIKVYNPFSLTYLFLKQVFNNYWFNSGTPSFLSTFLEKNKAGLKNIQKRIFDQSSLTTLTIGKVSPATLLYQAGYLTIKSYDRKMNTYKLSYPNEEIKQSMVLIEMAVLTQLDNESIGTIAYNLKYALLYKDIESFIQCLESLLASIPHNLHIVRESYYHSLLQMICTLLSIDNACEVSTSKGSIDLIIETSQYLYVCELKFNKSPQEALEQIKKKKYHEKYLAQNKEIVLLGIAFYLNDREVELDWLAEELT